MFGIAFIIVGIVLLLQALGYLGSIPAGVIWGIALIVIGISFLVRRSRRQERREQWLARRREKEQETSDKK